MDDLDYMIVACALQTGGALTFGLPASLLTVK
jgi:hypothetical protein